MVKLDDSCYVVLEPTLSRPDSEGRRRATSFRATRITRGLPVTRSGETAVRLNLTVDSSVFEALIPIVEIELGERDLFVNTAVEVTAIPEEPDSENDSTS